MFVGEGSNGEARFTSTMIKWLVVDVLSSYNAIIGRGTQMMVHMRMDIKYLTITFRTNDRDVAIYVNQKESPKCDVCILKDARGWYPRTKSH